MMTIPYTYFIKWSSTGYWYYGVRYKQGCHPDDFWVEYFTSSKSVDTYREQHGDPDIIQIRKTFDSIDEAIDWEYRVLKRMNVPFREDSLNQACFPVFNRTGYKHTPETIEKLSGENNHFYGKKHSPETLKILTEKATGRVITPEQREKQRQKMLGRKPWNTGKKRGPMSTETKKLISEAMKGRESPRKGKKGSPNPNKGKKLGPTGRPAWNRGKPTPPEVREKQRQSHLGKTLSEEHKKKIKESWVRRRQQANDRTPSHTSPR